MKPELTIWKVTNADYQLYTNGFCLQMKHKDWSIRIKHEVFFLTNVFPCISFININRGTLENTRESISTSLSSILGKQQTRGRYISEGYLYFLSYYSRSYQNLFSDDPVQITSLKNVRGSITLKTYRQGYLYILSSRQNTICQWKRNFSAVYCPILHHLYCRAVLGSYSFYLPLQKG